MICSASLVLSSFSAYLWWILVVIPGFLAYKCISLLFSVASMPSLAPQQQDEKDTKKLKKKARK
jgi:hypothetical protein